MKTSNYDIDYVLRYAEQAVQDEQFTRAVATLMATLNGEQFAHVAATLMATLYTHPMPAETCRAIVEAAEIAVVEVFGLGQDVGWDLAVRWAGVERTRPMQGGQKEKKTKVIPLQALRAWEICRENGWSLSKRVRGVTIGKVAVKMKRSPRMVRRYLKPFFDTNDVDVKDK